MKLALCSGAAPDLSWREVLEVCAGRGLSAVELVAEHAHGIGPGTAPDAWNEDGS